ncbi:MAG: DNA repair protein RadA [Roseburia sp.]|nr:DNA repair protein RadA [Roseburia sp.]MCM1278225.1 DNA repair protein RadA [Robinsoniella sp.]
MAKGKRTMTYFCQSCGHESAKWMGQCPSCREWNTFVEEEVAVESKGMGGAKTVRAKAKLPVPVSFSQVSLSQEDKMKTDMEELDQVLGGGIVPGSLTLVGGDPGIGKSTLLLQVCRQLSGKGQKVLYISGEESLKQIKLRAMRIGHFSEDLLLLCETNLESIREVLMEQKPQVAVIDSIQTMYSEEISAAPGSVSQVREATGVFMQLAKTYGISIFIVGHVTKEGTVAGPRVLEHMVDTVLYFEGDKDALYRILRSVKNRFGSTNEIGVFEMAKDGLREVKNPSAFLLEGRPRQASGSVVVCSMEGTRPILIEIQALVCDSSFNLPRRQADGMDYNRVHLLMAVIEKRMCLHISHSDAYVNVAGGMKVSEPAIDLGVVMAILSSFKNRPVKEGMVVFGEIGLSGEVRAVSMAEKRVLEAKKLGFTTCVLPKSNRVALTEIEGIELIGVENVQDIADLV